MNPGADASPRRCVRSGRRRPKSGGLAPKRSDPQLPSTPPHPALRRTTVRLAWRLHPPLDRMEWRTLRMPRTGVLWEGLTMRRTFETFFLLGLLATALGSPAAWAEAIDPADLAQRQDKSMYRPEDVGLRAYVAEVKCSDWLGERLLANASLSVGWPEAKFETVGVQAGKEVEAMLKMREDYLGMRALLDRAGFRLASILQGHQVTCEKNVSNFEITATRETDRARVPDGQPARHFVVLREDGQLLHLRTEMEDGITIMSEKYSYEDRDGRHQAGFYGMVTSQKGAERDEPLEFAEVRVTYELVEGFWLPTRVEKKAHAPGEEGATTTAWTIRYRSVNGAQVAEAGAEGGPFSTPEATVKSFFQAAAKRDGGMMAKCFSENAPKEFQPILKHELTEEMLDELKGQFGDAEVLSSEVSEGKAEVQVRYRVPGGDWREDTIEMIQDQGEWKILDF